jgi:hypothetical protein
MACGQLALMGCVPVLIALACDMGDESVSYAVCICICNVVL